MKSGKKTHKHNQKFCFIAGREKNTGAKNTDAFHATMSQHDFVRTYDTYFNLRWSNPLATMDSITSDQLDLIDSLETTNQHTCPPNCVCQQMKKAEILIDDILVADIHTNHAVPLPIADSEIFKALEMKNRSAVRKKLQTGYDKFKGTKSREHYLADTNQSRCQQYLEQTCSYIAQLDNSAGYDDMKEIACLYACDSLCCLATQYEVAFDFWAKTLIALVHLNPDHLLTTCMDFLSTQFEAFSHSVKKQQRVFKCVQLLIHHFPNEMEAQFAE